MPEEKKPQKTYEHSSIILDRMIKKYGKSQTKFANDILGISGVNISKARKDKQIPDHWFEIVNEKLSITKEELCRPPQKVTSALEQPYKIDTQWAVLGAPEDDEEIPEEELISMTRNVLRSNTVYRSALASNIRAFNQAVEGEKEMDDMRKSMERMESGMNEMRDMMRQLLARELDEKKRAGNDL